MCRTTQLLRLIGILALGVAVRTAAPADRSTHAAQDARTDAWRNYTTGNGVRDLAVDPRTGDVWAAAGGVVHWDRVTESYRKYTVLNGLASNDVGSVAIDVATGDKWFGSSTSGVSRLGADGQWQTFTIDDGLASNSIQGIAIDPHTGDRWFGTGAGVSRLGADGQWRTFTTADGLTSDRVTAIAIDARTGDKWFGTFMSGVSRLGADGQWQTFTTDDGLASNFIQEIAIDAATGDKWFGACDIYMGTGCGVSRLGADGLWRTFTTADGLANDWASAIAIDAATGDKWFGSFMSGVSRLSADGQWRTFTTADGLADDWTTAIAVDAATGSVWFGTGAGVSRLGADGDWRTFTTADALVENSVNAVAIDAATGDKWFGSGEVNRLDANGQWQTFTEADGLVGRPITAIAVDGATGDKWFGTQAFGVYKLGADGQWQWLTTDDGLASNMVTSIAIDGATGDTWFGTDDSGASRLGADGRWHTFTTTDGLVDDHINAIAIDAATGDTWFGTGDVFGFADGGGASRLGADGEWRTFTTADGLADKAVTAIAIETATGDIWFGTTGGVSRLGADGRWQTLTTADGLANDQVTAVAIDPATGEKWFGTEGGGLSHLDANGQWRTFTATDGLGANYVQAIAIDAATGDKWFGTDGGGVAQLSVAPNAGLCQDAVPIEPGPQLTMELIGADDVTLYRFDITEPFTRLDITLTDPDNHIAGELFRTCDSSAGPGGGHHIGAGTGRHIGAEQRLARDVTFETGAYYLAITTEPGVTAFPLQYNLQISLAPVDRATIRSLIFTHEPRIEALFSPADRNLDAWQAELNAWREALRGLADTADMRGVLIQDLESDTDPTVAQAYAGWVDADQGDYAARARDLVYAVQDWIARARAEMPNLEYVVLAGDDRVIPYLRARVPGNPLRDDGWVDEKAYLDGSGIAAGSAIGNALLTGATLTDDAYGAAVATVWGVGQEIYVPELAVGRLLERPREMTRAIEAYKAAGGSVKVARSLTAGWDFMYDATYQAAGLLRPRVTTHTHLPGSSWGIADLRLNLLDSRRDLAFLAAHGDHDTCRLGDGTLLPAYAVAQATAEMGGSLVYALACHGGLNVPDDPTPQARALDFPQAWLARGAAYVGTTGWAYGQDRFLGYEEALLVNFTDELLKDGATIGGALVKAKERYHNANPPGPMHAKTLLGTVLYGLPMYRVSTMSGRSRLMGSGDAEGAPIEPAARPLRRVAPEVWVEEDQPYRFQASDLQLERDPEGQWAYYSLTGLQPRAEAGEPVQPTYQKALGKVVLDGTKTFEPRGVVLTRATYRDETDFQPLIERAGTAGTVPAQTGTAGTVPAQTGTAGTVPAQTGTPPRFDEPGWFPRVPLKLRLLYRTDHRGRIDREQTQADLLISVGQYNASPGSERLFEEFLVDEYYSASEDRTGPAVDSFAAEPDGSGSTLRLRFGARDESGLLRSVVTYVVDGQPWMTAELQREDGTDLWTGLVPSGADFLVQLVDGAGNVTTVDSQGSVSRPEVRAPGDSRLWRSVFLPAAGK